jgi:ribosomal protein S18 acetylase RimI-like enzyme
VDGGSGVEYCRAIRKGTPLKVFYSGSTKPTEDGLLVRWLTDEEGDRVCVAEFMHDSRGNAVVIQLDTPKFYRGLGYARKLLSEIHKRETTGQLRVVSNDHARSYYEKLGYTEVAPNVYCAS